jgi:sulfatase modifying factor 1
MVFKRHYYLIFLAVVVIGLTACKQKTNSGAVVKKRVAATKSAVCCESNIPARFPGLSGPAGSKTDIDKSHKGMVWIKGGTFGMGGDNKQAGPDEYPKHKVTVNGFWIDATEVTNAQFDKFVKAPGYVTTAEKKPD